MITTNFHFVGLKTTLTRKNKNQKNQQGNNRRKKNLKVTNLLFLTVIMFRRFKNLTVFVRQTWKELFQCTEVSTDPSSSPTYLCSSSMRSLWYITFLKLTDF